MSTERIYSDTSARYGRITVDDEYCRRGYGDSARERKRRNESM